MLGSFWNHFGINLGTFWDQFWNNLGLIWDDFWIILGSVWNQYKFGLILKPLGHPPFVLLLGQIVMDSGINFGALGSQFAHFWYQFWLILRLWGHPGSHLRIVILISTLIPPLGDHYRWILGSMLGSLFGHFSDQHLIFFESFFGAPFLVNWAQF